MARPTKLTPEVQKTEVLTPDLPTGSPLWSEERWQKFLKLVGSNVCESAAFTQSFPSNRRQTLSEWKAQHPDVADAIKKAQDGFTARVELRLASKIDEPDAPWTLIAWYLERTMPDKYGKKERHEFGGIPAEAGGQPIQFVVADIDLQVVTDADSDAGEAQEQG